MRRILTLVVAGMVLSTSAFAQESAPLILDERPGAISATRRGPTATPKPAQQKDVAPAAPTPNPEDIFVAVVNSRRMTRAELNVRVSSQYEKARAEVQKRIGGIIAVDTESFPLLSDVNDDEADDVLEEQKVHIEAAMRREEEVALKNWVEHSILADEARRQGLAVGESEFRARLAAAEKESELDAATVDRVLNNFQMTRAEYEKSVYEALLIEKLLDRFISLNYTEEQYRQAYDKAPHLFYEPEKFTIAHYAIALTGDETDTDAKSKKAVASKVRALLRAGETPDAVFSMEEFAKSDKGMGGTSGSTYTLNEQVLPPVVEVEARKLKPGEVSEVLTSHRRSGGKVMPVSHHVVLMMERHAPTGDTFESALPQIRNGMLLLAREALVARLYEAKTHRVITNLGGIKPERVPNQEEIIRHEASAQPVSLKLPQS